MMWIYFPVVLVGVIVAVYWSRVIRLTRKVKRRGKSANVIPTGLFGTLTRILWIPVIALWILLPLVSPVLGGRWFAFHPLYLNLWIDWLAAGVALFALLATLVCWQKLGRSWRLGIDPNETTNLVVSGPYAYVRHPIYALSSLLMLATTAVYPAPIMLLVAVIHLILLQLQARREEAYLATVHGQSYVDYSRRVGRFFPNVLALGNKK